MEFLVIKTSDKTPPCEKAYQKQDSDSWFVELQDMDALIRFMERVKREIVLSRSYDDNFGKPYPRIEIVDEYRE